MIGVTCLGFGDDAQEEDDLQKPLIIGGAEVVRPVRRSVDTVN